MLNNVFSCPICWLKFSQSDREPITLSCGHVICKECITKLYNNNSVQCSLDKKMIQLDLNDLPICYTILDHLPTEASDFSCKAHPTKKIRYNCSYDSEYFCSKCLPLHTKSPHAATECCALSKIKPQIRIQNRIRTPTAET